MADFFDQSSCALEFSLSIVSKLKNNKSRAKLLRFFDFQAIPSITNQVTLLKILPWICSPTHLKWIHLKLIGSNLISKLFSQQNYSNLVLVLGYSTNESVLANSKMILSLLLYSYPAHCPNETFLHFQKYYDQIVGAKKSIF